jgi:hypothetical protein
MEAGPGTEVSDDGEDRLARERADVVLEVEEIVDARARLVQRGEEPGVKMPIPVASTAAATGPVGLSMS